MKKAEYTVDFASSVDKIWQVVTDNSNYAWRSDLSKIEVSGGGILLWNTQRRDIRLNLR